MAHGQPELLQILLRRLDDEHNDIIVHIDSKSPLTPESILETNPVKKGHIRFIHRIPSTWGGYSLIQVELNLLRESLKMGTHSYYHLLSGSDLPLYPISQINAFYERRQGKEFLNFFDKEECLKQYNLRLKYKHWFRDKCGRDKNVYTILNKLGLCIQQLLRIKNSIPSENFYCGSQWWDITEDLARYVLDHEYSIRRTYQYSSCCDEAFVQSLVWNSKFREQLFVPELGNGTKGNMRWIDLARGINSGAYVIKTADLPNIMESGMLFARKFDFEHHPEVINALQSFCASLKD
ncbi:hypothetical protein JS528_07320 [Bifidobacterium sp. MA2]|uniref:Peptide O-xylosyltransferase n=1 Tax=Bifidobacterium santillanense TaxID=2809028 RepID=A0ABS5UQI3_9BIFI|nr:beta-1,6-N-acetylglucosaminyltransferase [Bifidobacterium santillanense]MBT1173162.1 hypothetical protein [Bifidobacterium santillanense]